MGEEALKLPGSSLKELQKIVEAYGQKTGGLRCSGRR